ncbi:MAG: hypothetical protein AAFR47_05860 [Pseudomonadota bacterium]
MILAINKVEEAPALRVAGYGLVADLLEAVPDVTDQLRGPTGLKEGPPAPLARRAFSLVERRIAPKGHDALPTRTPVARERACVLSCHHAIGTGTGPPFSEPAALTLGFCRRPVRRYFEGRRPKRIVGTDKEA